MMEGLDHGWGMGYGWIIVIVVSVVLIWLIVKVVYHNRNAK
jgi:putative membrane protein